MDVMTDLETLGTKSNSVILAIGAVEFDLRTYTLGRKFYVVVGPQSCIDAGLQMDVSTVMWWMEQSDEARAAFKRESHPLRDCLEAFSEWYPKGAQQWGNGATFDNVLLGNAYKALGLKQPWLYTADRCYRTLKALYPDIKADDTGGTKHNALADAKYQALHAMKIYKEAGLK